MSESYDPRGIPLPPVDRPSGSTELAPTQPPSAYEVGDLQSEAPRTETRSDNDYAPSLGAAADPDVIPATTPIVPAASVTSRSLTLVIAIMCFFACLTAGTVYLINKSASGWLNNLASEITVQIEPVEDTNADQTVSEAVRWLEARRGIINATPISEAASRALLEPWLGKSDALSELPIPRLIALQLDQSINPDFTALRTDLAQQFPTATLDDHRQWQAQIKTVTRSFALGGLAILLLVGAATMAIIVSATRSAMLSNREIVEVLHFVGANDRFIAREFERNFLKLGIRAGLVGAAAAVLVFLAMPTILELLGGGTVTLAEIKRFIGSGSLDAIG
ncbi:MAG: ABC transporter permease, partial [Pseudomonadota bacterium]